MYNGAFKDGLFNGEGILLLRGAETAMLVQAGRAKKLDTGLGLAKLRAPQLAPSELVNFKGTFGGDYQETYEQFFANQYDKAFIEKHMDPVEGDYCDIDMMEGIMEQKPSSLRLELLKTEDEKYKSPKFVRYFDKDEHQIQHPGVTLPDMGLAFYKLRIDGCPADCLHLQNGCATYADGSEYTGEFKNGHPDGSGSLEQIGAEGGLNCSAKYNGLWQAGKRHGDGRYEIFMRKSVSDAHMAQQLLYKGQWAEDKRHGRGYQRIDDKELQKTHAGGFGYKEYFGYWEGDLRHGERCRLTAEALKSETGNETFVFTYIGDFWKGRRQGFGKVFVGRVVLDDEAEFMRSNNVADTESTTPLTETAAMAAGMCIYNGKWRDDLIFADAENPAWAVCAPRGIDPGWKDSKCVYLGGFSRYGAREGLGMLYDVKIIPAESRVAVAPGAAAAVGGAAKETDNAADSPAVDPELWKHFTMTQRGTTTTGKEYLDLKQDGRLTLPSGGIAKEEFNVGGTHELKLYAGEFEGNLPGGHGIQFVELEQPKKGQPARTLYEGQFKDGLRHGMACGMELTQRITYGNTTSCKEATPNATIGATE
jgi:hypothetical protein